MSMSMWYSQRVLSITPLTACRGLTLVQGFPGNDPDFVGR